MKLPRVHASNGRWFYVETLEERGSNGRGKQKWHPLSRVDEGPQAIVEALARLRITPPARGRNDQTILYRHFDDQGQLLYVGVAFNVLERLNNHRRGSRWFDRIKTITLERFGTREEALIAEVVAIINEAPQENRHHASRRKPSA